MGTPHEGLQRRRPVVAVRSPEIIVESANNAIRKLYPDVEPAWIVVRASIDYEVLPGHLSAKLNGKLEPDSVSIAARLPDWRLNTKKALWGDHERIDSNNEVRSL